ncbi:MAG TPA: MerR family transcriptional regulator [Gaiellaceae bacterium]|nr:MerR family transcriptional regulator [Gaiellaceae bacterium]
MTELATDAPADRRLRIGEAAQRAGVSERTLRYYEEIGLITPSGHSAGGCREYGPDELARVARIRELQELIGLNLEEIRGVVTREDRIESIRDAFRQTDDPKERTALVIEALEMTEALHSRVAAKVERIAEFRDELAGRIVRYNEILASGSPSAAGSPAAPAGGARTSRS